MKIILEIYDARYIVEIDHDDLDANEVKEIFSRMLVQAGYSPAVIELNDDYGNYEYVGEDEIVIKREELDKLKGGENDN